MKERLVTLALALAAFAAFYVLMAPKPDGPEGERATRPLTIEEGPNGYLALTRWLSAEGVPVLSLRDRYGKLDSLPGLEQPTGNLLLVTAPQFYPVRNSELAPLRAWVNRGNTLLIVAGLSDTPDWSMEEGIDPDFMTNMREMTGLRFMDVSVEDMVDGKPETDQTNDTESAAAEQTTPDAAESGPAEAPATETNTPETDTRQATADDDEPTEQKPSPKEIVQDAVEAMARFKEPQRFETKPVVSHPLLDGVRTVGALSEYPSAKWRGWRDMGDFAIELAREPASQAPTLWVIPSVQGTIIVSAYGSVFTNKVLGGDDNAQLLANIVRWSVRKGGKVIVDDAHQGLVGFYDPDAFFSDRRLHLTVWWLLGLWLVFVLSSQRLRPALSKWSPVDLTGFVRATGGFMARVLKPATVGQQLFANFFNETRRGLGWPQDGEPVWDWLQSQATVASQDVERLQELYGKVQRGRRVDLSQVHNLLVRVRTALK